MCPLRSHGELGLDWALMAAAGLVDRVQVTIFPVIAGRTGVGADIRGCRRFRPRPVGEPDAGRSRRGDHLQTVLH